MRRRQQIWPGCLRWNRRQLVMHLVIKTSQLSRWPINSSCRRFSTTFDKVLNLEVCMHFYRPQTKFREGNVLTGVCQSVRSGRGSGRGSGSAFPPYPPGIVPPWNHTPRTILPRTVPRGLCPLGTVPPSGPYQPSRNHKSGRYVSYCNAALLSIESTGGPLREERSRPFCTLQTFQSTVRRGC